MDSEPRENTSPRSESLAFYIFLAAVILTPLAFLPTPYLSLDLIKTVIIVFGTLVSGILYAFVIKRKKSITLPPATILWTSILLGISIIISAATSTHFIKSFFGQGFEVHTASLLLILFVAAYVTYLLVHRHPERAIIFYVGSIISFLILAVFHVLRFIFGVDFADLSILNTLTSTVFGSWYELAIFALLVALVTIVAMVTLPLSNRLKVLYWIVAIAGLGGAFIINNTRAWLALTIVLAGVFCIQILSGKGDKTISERISFPLLILIIICAFMTWRGGYLAGPIVQRINATYFEPILPWNMTLDVSSGVLKESPLFGVGPNRFSNAFITYKPAVLNSTPFWNVEFATGFGRIPSFIVTQGLVGTSLWIMFFIFYGVYMVKSLRRVPSSSHERFIVISTYAGATFLWLTNLLYTPSHTILFYTFMLTGASLGVSVAYKSVKAKEFSPSGKSFPSFVLVAILIAVVWGLMYIKKSTALAYFAAGVRQLTVSKDTVAADKAFNRALLIDKSDIYYQAEAEMGLIKVGALTSSLQQGGSVPKATVDQVGVIIGEALAASKNAIEYDDKNYYNHVSEARVLELAARLGLPNAYENAVKAYNEAIKINTFNPGLYLSLARLATQQNKQSEAVQAIGAALQVKSNYIDAIFLLSQIEAARGNLRDAITAARAATELNPDNPILYLQLGLLQYNNKEYGAAVTSLSKAVELQPDYANAKYFLGLSYSRLGRNVQAIEQFEQLAATNPDSQEVALILSNLKAGRSAFVDAKPPVTPTPEKRTNLPLRERQR